MNILILSCGTRSLLVDYFKNRKNGFDKVVVTDCSANSHALYRADKYYLMPRMTHPNYLPTLFDICKQEEIHAVLPLQEDELVLIAEHREEFLARDILPVISEPNTINMCRDKYGFYKRMTEIAVPVILTYLTSEADSIIAKCGFPLFMKPRYGAGSISSYVINNANAIRGNIKNEQKDFILQPYVDGTEYGVNLYVDFVTGKLSEVFILEKIRMRAGETEKSISVHDEEIMSIINRICENVPLLGPIDIDLINKDGKYYVLEINPRFGGAYPHTHECGVNFIKLIANNTRNIANDTLKMKYEDGVVAFRYMAISTMKKEDMPYEK